MAAAVAHGEAEGAGRGVGIPDSANSAGLTQARPRGDRHMVSERGFARRSLAERVTVLGLKCPRCEPHQVMKSHQLITCLWNVTQVQDRRLRRRLGKVM